MKDDVRDDVRDESLETPLNKGFLPKNVRDGLVQEKQHASSRRMLLVESKSEFDETPIACKIILSIWLQQEKCR